MFELNGASVSQLYETTDRGQAVRIKLENQVALVTGASSGIGAATALALAKAGAAVAINYHSQPRPAEALARKIMDGGGRAIAVGADVGNEREVERMFAQTLEAFGALDILIANSGLQRDAAIQDMSLEEWDTVLRTNLTGQFLCARAAIRLFQRQGIRDGISKAAGKIVHMSSVHQRIPWAGHANYAASKGGVDLLMRTLAQEVAPQHIRVNGIAPGAIRTAINAERAESDSSELLELIPYGRVGDAEDVANAAVWLASDASDYVVGETLFIDGGMSLYPEFRHNG